MKTLFFLLALLISTSVGAATCRYVKTDGQVLYANVPIQNAKKGACFGAEDPVPEKPKAKNSSKNPTPADFPKVDSATQQARDGTRKQVLQTELETERAALAQAKTNNKPDEINLHNLNIQMLEKELASVK
ncbi:MAG: hypothetical protein ACKVN9_08515 [Methylophilaceae bacterium]